MARKESLWWMNGNFSDYAAVGLLAAARRSFLAFIISLILGVVVFFIVFLPNPMSIVKSRSSNLRISIKKAFNNTGKLQFLGEPSKILPCGL